jgi:hypothetical protein
MYRLMVGCLTFSGEYFIHIQDDNKLKKKSKNIQKWGKDETIVVTIWLVLEKYGELGREKVSIV